MARPPQPHAQPKIHEDQPQPLRPFPTVAEAKEALAAHERACPGSHFDCFGHPEKELARQAWLTEKALLQADLDAATRTSAATWRSVPISTPIPKEPNPMPVKSTPQAKLESMLARLAKYVNSGDKHQYHLASNLRSKIRGHCEQEGIPVPVLPVTPAQAHGNGRRTPQPELKSLASPRDAEKDLALRLDLPAEQVHQASKSATHLAPEDRPTPARTPSTHLGVVRALAHEVRRQVWDLLSRVDGLSHVERADPELVAELANLDAASHLVATYAATGKLEVASW